MSTKHTPGPWRVVHDDGVEGCRAIFSEESGICSTDGAYDDAEDAANARLIAAAPELLEALAYALKDMEQVRASEAGNRMAVSIGMARAAIANATGSAS